MVYTTNEVLKIIHGLVSDALCDNEGEQEIENALMQIELNAVEYLLDEEEKERK